MRTKKSRTRKSKTRKFRITKTRKFRKTKGGTEEEPKLEQICIRYNQSENYNVTPINVDIKRVKTVSGNTYSSPKHTFECTREKIIVKTSGLMYGTTKIEIEYHNIQEINDEYNKNQYNFSKCP